jgi:hypothetical protein
VASAFEVLMNRLSTIAIVFVGLLVCSLGCASKAPVESATGAGGMGGAPTTASSSGGAPCVPVNDENPCTDDLCEDGLPVHSPTPAGSPCSMSGARGLPLPLLRALRH